MIVFKGGRRSASGARTGLLKTFGRLIAYLTEGPRDALNPDRVAWSSCRNLDGVNDPARVAQVMRAHASHHPRAQNPVYHFGLSLHPEEHLSPEQWDQAVDLLLQRLGLGRHQALVVAHRDTDHEHVHVVVNRVGDDDRAWKQDKDLVKASGAIRRIEVDYGLTCDGSREVRAPIVTSGAYRKALRTGQQPLADRVRDQAATAFAEATGWGDLETRLAVRGFRLEPAARRIPRPAEIKSEMARVTDTLRTLHQASRGAQDAIETAIRGMGSSAVENALLLLPPEVALPVNLAERAVAHATERTLGLVRSLELSLGR